MAGVKALSMQACFRYQSIKTSTTLIFTCLSNQLPLGAGANQKEDWTLRLGPCWPRAFEGIHQTRNYMWPVCAFFPGGLLIFHWSLDVLNWYPIRMLQKCVVKDDFHTSIHRNRMSTQKREKCVKNPWKHREGEWKTRDFRVTLISKKYIHFSYIFAAIGS